MLTGWSNDGHIQFFKKLIPDFDSKSAKCQDDMLSFTKQFICELPWLSDHYFDKKRQLVKLWIYFLFVSSWLIMHASLYWWVMALVDKAESVGARCGVPLKQGTNNANNILRKYSHSRLLLTDFTVSLLLTLHVEILAAKVDEMGPRRRDLNFLILNQARVITIKIFL